MKSSEVKAMIEIPEKFARLLEGSPYQGPVVTVVSAVSKILEDNKMPFFPGFTDHGTKHVESVLETEVKLIPKEVWDEKVLASADAAVIVCATVLHDIAMHIREPGFLALAKGETDHKPLPWFDKQQGARPPDKPWPELWGDFFLEARRWSDRMLHQVFGPPPEEGSELWKVRELPKDHREWNEYDKLVVGEFIRRHHGRLAHEIAHYGFPGLETGTGEGQFPTPEQVDRPFKDLCDLIGLTARSHSLDLRECVDYLESQYGEDLRPQGAVPVYHMALLRVADYLQIDADRAPFLLLRLRDPQSPASIGEWHTHRAVRHLSYQHKDPKAISIQLGREHRLRTHLQLQELLQGLQKQMDHSAAVLDEVYGRVTDHNLHLLKLAKSRVRSNIDLPSFTDELPYEPVKAGFSADPHLLSLLVTPLYGDHPEIAIRELLQNAVDAVRERQHYCRSHGIDESGLEYPDQDCDVLIEFRESDDGSWLLIVRDKGIGMTESTIRDYFLRAGACFRECPSWRQEFTDQEGKATVLRSGRFGIGVLAGFLIGDQIMVKTRHVGEKRGYAFEAQTNSELIQLKREHSCAMGTTVRIPVTSELARAVVKYARDIWHNGVSVPPLPRANNWSGWPWEWYGLEQPVVQYQVQSANGDCFPLGQKWKLPSPDVKELPPAWRAITADGYDVVHWSYKKAPQLTCNGIMIGSYDYSVVEGDLRRLAVSEPRLSWANRSEIYPLYTPLVSVFDSEGNLPLDITRTRLDDLTLPFDAELLDDVLNDLLAFSLVLAPNGRLWFFPGVELQHNILYPLMRLGDLLFGDELPFLHWFCGQHGAGPLDPWIFAQTRIGTLLVRSTVRFARRKNGFGGPPHMMPNSTEVAVLSWPLFYSAEPASRDEDTKSYRLRSLHQFVDTAGRLSWLLNGTAPPREWVGNPEIKPPSTVDFRVLVALPTDDYQFEELSLSGLEPRPVAEPSCKDHTTYEISWGNTDNCNAAADYCLGPQTDWFEPRAIPFLLEIHFREPRTINDLSPLAKKWKKHIGERLIPFHPVERRKLIEKVAAESDEMRHHIEAWQREADEYRRTWREKGW